MLTEEQIEKLSEEFKENLRKGNTEKLNSFYEKETWVLEQGKTMEQKILEEVAIYKSKKKTCPKCKKSLKLVAHKKRLLKTSVGDIAITRPYFYCAECHKTGYFESDSPFYAGNLSGKLSESVCLLASQLPFEIASDLLFRLIGISVCPSSMEKISEQIGETFRAQEHQAAQKPPSEIAHKVLAEKEELPQRVYAQMDGAMINTLEGWKENKLGIIFNETDLHKSGTGENERISIKKKTLVTSLAQGLDDFKDRFKHWMVQTRAQWATEIIFITDGAIWIDHFISDHYMGCIHILDWFHLTEHLWDTAKKIYGENSPKARIWVEEYKDMFYNGKEKEALTRILRAAKSFRKNQTTLFDLYNYLNSRRDKIRYKYFRSKGYYLGSGAVESANRYAIQDRLKKAGMKWSIEGANAIAFLRTQYLSNNWATFAWAA